MEQNLEQRLKELEVKREEYKFIIHKLLDNPFELSEDERIEFTEQNKIKIAELQLISEEMRDIEWKLMGPEKQKEYIEKYKED